MKTILSAFIAIAVLAGVAGAASAEPLNATTFFAQQARDAGN